MALADSTRARLQATAACAGTFILWWRFGGVFTAGVTGFFSSLAVLAWLAPARYAPVQRWLDFLVRQFVTGFSWLLLGLLYLGLFTPLRGWRFLTRNDPLQRKADPTATTYFQPLPPAAPGRFKRLF